MSSHIAGTYNDEYQRLADYMIEEFTRWKNNEPLLYRVTDDML
jgi:phosphoglycerate dehydrogenase-like enzyme